MGLGMRGTVAHGPWSFEFDDQDRGLAERWYAGGRPLSHTITVPYAFYVWNCSVCPGAGEVIRIDS